MESDALLCTPVPCPAHVWCSQQHTVSDTNQAAQPDPVTQQLSGLAATLFRYFGDLTRAAPVVLGIGAGAALVLGFLWIFLLEWVSRAPDMTSQPPCLPSP